MISTARGATRFVILGRRRAYKLPSLASWRLFLNGLLANLQEREFSTTGWPQLCPVLWSLPGGWLVVMPRCVVMSPAEYDDFPIEEFLWSPDYEVPVERKADSFGRLPDGRLVAIDYGS